MRPAAIRALTSALVLVLAAGACATAGGDQTVVPPRASTSAAIEPPEWPWDLADAGVDVPASVPLEEIRSGGPPPDGIPPIDDPVFEPVTEADLWLDANDPVQVFELGGDVRAYPLAILTFHEIVNDVVDQEPVVVTYCPLCNSGLVFKRTVGGDVLDFGTSGRLLHSNLVMYDRATRSLWQQFTGEAIVGEHLGQELERLPAQVVSWDEFSRTWPEGQVLSRDTGHNRTYGRNPYVRYDSSVSPFLFEGESGGPLAQMERVVTTGGAEDPVAYPLSLLTRRRVVTDEVVGKPVVVLWAPGTASALDAERVSDGRDVGATGVFRPSVAGQDLTFEPHGKQRFRDVETSSIWTVVGRAVDGPLEGRRLERVAHDDTFWFVQYAFRPETRVVNQ